MKPFMLASFWLLMQSLTRPSYWRDSLAGICLLIATIIKPSFALVFPPAVGLYILFTRQRFVRSVISLAIFSLPTMVLLVVQYTGYYADDDGLSVILSPFTIWNVFSPSIPVSIVLALAFPIVLTVYRYRKAMAQPYLFVAWLTTLIGVVQFALLAEQAANGRLDYAGNWINGYLNGMSLVFLICLVEYVRWLREYREGRVSQRWGFRLTTGLLMLHLLSGLFYVFWSIFPVKLPRPYNFPTRTRR